MHIDWIIHAVTESNSIQLNSAAYFGLYRIGHKSLIEDNSHTSDTQLLVVKKTSMLFLKSFLHTPILEQL